MENLIGEARGEDDRSRPDGIESGRGALALNAPILPPGQIYQAWLSVASSASHPTSAGTPQSIGLLAATGGVNVVTFAHRGAGVAFPENPVLFVTVEPEDGSPAPTGPIVAQPPDGLPQNLDLP